MPNPFEHVQPGDVIRAQDFVAMGVRISQLEARVAALELGAGSPTTELTIVRMTPPDRGEINSFVEIHGTGYGTPPSVNTVTIGGVLATEYRVGFDDAGAPYNSANRLSVRVPSALASAANPLPDNGRPVEVVVTRGAETARWNYRVMPESGPPVPSITSVVNASTGMSAIRAGLTAAVIGQNFSATAAENRIRVRVPNLDVTIPPGSITVTSAAVDRVEFTFPAIPNLPADGADAFVLLTVQAEGGGGTPAEQERTIRVVP